MESSVEGSAGLRWMTLCMCLWVCWSWAHGGAPHAVFAKNQTPNNVCAAGTNRGTACLPPRQDSFFQALRLLLLYAGQSARGRELQGAPGGFRASVQDEEFLSLQR